MSICFLVNLNFQPATQTYILYRLFKLLRYIIWIMNMCILHQKKRQPICLHGNNTQWHKDNTHHMIPSFTSSVHPCTFIADTVQKTNVWTDKSSVVAVDSFLFVDINTFAFIHLSVYCFSTQTLVFVWHFQTWILQILALLLHNQASKQHCPSFILFYAANGGKNKGLKSMV